MGAISDSRSGALSAWKILITEGLEENGQAILRAAAQVDDRPGLASEELLRVIGRYDALVVREQTILNQAAFNAAVRLQVVGRAGVGVENIDLAAATVHNVTVVNTPTASTLAVAELALGLLLALARSIPRVDSSLKTGQWPGVYSGQVGVEINGKTIGLLGMGRIGSAVARRTAALGMTVLGSDPLLSFEEVARRGAQPVPLEALYAGSDFISVHVPLTPETRGMIGGQALSQMKRGVRLVCTARGGIIDETALLGALDSGQVSGAALDVFSREPPGLVALVSHPHVIATPHIGARTQEALSRSAEDVAVEVLAALRGEPLRWQVV